MSPCRRKIPVHTVHGIIQLLNVMMNFKIINVPRFKGIVSRDFVVCFLVKFDRSDISTHQEWVLLLLKVRFRVKFFDFCAWA
jgi:hypothetical protein